MAADDSTSARPRVALFVTCMVDSLYPDVGIATADLLEQHGADVIFPEGQTCCGQPAFNAGFRADASKMARHFLDVFWPLIHDGTIDAIVAPSGSCVAMVKHSYDILFEDGTDATYRNKARQVSGITYELTQYLVDVLRVDSTGAACTAKLAYHPCCHLLRDLRVDEQPRRLLSNVEGATAVDLPSAEECCGFGGLFAVKNAGISTAMARRKADHLSACGAELVAVNDVSCMTQLNGVLLREGHRCRAVHIATVLRKGQAPRGKRSHA